MKPKGALALNISAIGGQAGLKPQRVIFFRIIRPRAEARGNGTIKIKTSGGLSMTPLNS
jgi:hypothetical protein